MSASEFAYKLLFKFFNYQVYVIHERHKDLVKSHNWKRFWVEKRLKDGSFRIVYGLRTKPWPTRLKNY